MKAETEVKQQVREFYDQVGWQITSENLYQNARYEDLRPVAREYIHRCHIRVKRWIKSSGHYLLDAGSGPVQYPEYLTYSQGYRFHVCLDLSIVALKEARKRMGDHGLYVVGDVADLPFSANCFEGVVSLHTLHHLPVEEQEKAYFSLYRVLAPGCSAVVVNGWTDSALMKIAQPFIQVAEWLGRGVIWLQGKVLARGRGKETKNSVREATSASVKEHKALEVAAVPTGTYVRKRDASGLRQMLQGRINYEVRVWRSVRVRFLRALIHSWLGGKYWLRLLYRLEERFPHWLGEKGQYPMVIMRKDLSVLDE